MRRLLTATAIALACLSWPAYAASAEPPDEAFLQKILQERDDGQWHGRQHWLYDEENQPQTNAVAANPPGCTEYRIRVPKADAAKADAAKADAGKSDAGKTDAGTEIKRVQKCD